MNIGKTDWENLKTMTENEIIENAENDDDAPLLGKDDLATFQRVNPIEHIDVKLIRTKLDMTQDEFSSYFGFKIRTVQEWEQHRREPTGAAKNFLRVIEMEPRMVQRALSLKNNLKAAQKRFTKKVD